MIPRLYSIEMPVGDALGQDLIYELGERPYTKENEWSGFFALSLVSYIPSIPSIILYQDKTAKKSLFLQILYSIP